MDTKFSFVEGKQEQQEFIARPNEKINDHYYEGEFISRHLDHGRYLNRVYQVHSFTYGRFVFERPLTGVKDDFEDSHTYALIDSKTKQSISPQYAAIVERRVDRAGKSYFFVIAREIPGQNGENGHNNGVVRLLDVETGRTYGPKFYSIVEENGRLYGDIFEGTQRKQRVQLF
ncbi:MAG: hypothetical protein HYZ51_03240 [Candidatus Doudnabacteria bacterium]|nr:hypothetical protein [Candidatus Doudnabacteria bacterium]